MKADQEGVEKLFFPIVFSYLSFFRKEEISLLEEKPRKENLLTCSPPTTDSKRKAGFNSDSLA